MKKLTSIEEYNNLIKTGLPSLFYFSGNNCNVCKVLKPKITDLAANDFPKISIFEVNTEENKLIASQNSVFSIPTIILCFQGKELIRKSRLISIIELKKDIERYYDFF